MIGCGEKEQKPPVSEEAAAYFEHAQRAYEVGAYQSALMLTDSLAEHAPEFSGVYVLRGQIFTDLERYDAAAGALRRAAALDPHNLAVQFNLANNAYRREQYREALRRYRAVLQEMAAVDRVNIYAGDETGDKARYAIHLQMGRAYNDLGVADSARLQYNRAVAIAPGEPEAHRSLSKLLERQGLFSEALDHAKKALELQPDKPEYTYAVGLLLTKLGRFEAAVPYLRAMAKGQPWHHGAHYNLGQALMHLGRKQEAQQLLAQADSLQKARSRLRKQGKVAEANRRTPRKWVNYGNALYQAGRIDDARKAYRHVLTLLPRNVAVQNNMAILAMESGDTTEAIFRYRRILRQDPTLVDIWLNLGRVYARSGQKNKARKAWQNVLKHEPAHSEAQSYLAGALEGS